MSPTPNVTGTAATVESLSLFFVQLFVQLFPLFHHPTAPAPASAAPALSAAINATPGLTVSHQQVVTNAVNAAAATAPDQNA